MTPVGAETLPSGWRWATLGEVIVSMKNGIYRPASAYADDGLACLRMYNIGEGRIVWRDIKRMRLSESEIREYELLPGDLLVNRVNIRELVGKAAVISAGLERCVFESKNIRVRLRPDLAEPRFVSYRLLLSGSRYFTQNAQQVVGMASISQPQVARFPLPLPPLDEQRRIVAELEKQFTRLEAGVAALRRVQANFKRYRAAVLKAACEGRLVPTEAELARREGRSYETGEQLLARILIERRQKWTGRGKYKEPAALQSANLQGLPEGWGWATWDQIGFSQNGRPFPSAQYKSSGFRLLRPGNLHATGRVSWTEENTRYMPQHFADENPDLIVRGGELVMNLTAQSLKDEFLGRVCLTSEGEECLLNQRLARLVSILVPPKYVLCLLKSWSFRRFVDGLNSGSLIQHMFTSQLAEFRVPLPPLVEQERIVTEVDGRLSVVDELDSVVSANLQRATRLRQSVLERAFSGRLVSDDGASQRAGDDSINEGDGGHLQGGRS